MRHWRKMTWVLWIWVGLTILFTVGVNTWANNDVRETCIGDAFECDTAVSIASGVLTAIGVVIGFLGFFALSLVWLMTRPRGRGDPPTPSVSAWPPPHPRG